MSGGALKPKRLSELKAPYTYTSNGKVERPETIKVKINKKVYKVKWDHPFYSTLNHYGNLI
jgi:hypothetical protein